MAVKNVGEVSVNITGNDEQARKTLQGFIKEAGKEDVKLDLELDITEITKSIDQVKLAIEDLSDKFETIDGKNLFKEIDQSLNNLKENFESLITETKNTDGQLEKAFKVDFTDDFKKDIAEIKKSFESLGDIAKVIPEALGSEKIQQTTTALDRMGESIEVIANQLEKLVNFKGLENLRQPGDIEETLNQYEKDLDELQTKATETKERLKELREFDSYTTSKNRQKAFSDVFSFTKDTFDEQAIEATVKSMNRLIREAKKLDDEGFDLSKVFEVFKDSDGNEVKKSYLEALQLIEQFKNATEQIKKSSKEVVAQPVYAQIADSDFSKSNAKALEEITGRYLQSGITESKTFAQEIEELQHKIQLATSEYAVAKETFGSGLTIKIDDQSLTELSNKIQSAKMDLDKMGAIKIEGFDASTVKDFKDALLEIVTAINIVNTTLKTGINFTPVDNNLQEAKTRLKDFKSQLKDLFEGSNTQYSTKSIPGFDNLCNQVYAGMITVEDALVEAKKRLTDKLDFTKDTGAIEQSYTNLMKRVQTALVNNFPKIKLEDYSEVFDALRNGSIDAVTAFQRISEAERQMTVNVPLDGFTENTVKNIQDLIKYLQKSVTELHKVMLEFNQEFNTKMGTDLIDQHLQLSIQSSIQAAISIKEHMKEIANAITDKNSADSIIGATDAAIDYFNTTFAKALDLDGIEAQFKSISQMIDSLFEKDEQNKVFELKGLDTDKVKNLSTAINDLKTNVNNLKSSVDGLTDKINNGLAIKFDSSGIEKAEESTDQMGEQSAETAAQINELNTSLDKTGSTSKENVNFLNQFIEKLKELKNLCTDSDDITFFQKLIKDTETGKKTVIKALSDIQNRFEDINPNAGINSFSDEQKLERLKTLKKDVEEIQSLGSIKDLYGSGNEEGIKRFEKLNKYISEFQQKVKETQLILKDGTTFSFKDIFDIKNVNLDDVVGIKFTTDLDLLKKGIGEAEDIIKTAVQKTKQPTKSDLVDVSEDKKELEELKSSIKETQTAAKETGKSSTKSGKSTGVKVSVDPDVDAKDWKTKIESKLEPVSIPVNIDETTLNQAKADLETLTKSIKEATDITEISLPQNFLQTLEELKNKLQKIDNKNSRSLVEEIESITVALAMLDQVDLSNLNLAKIFNVGDSAKNIKQLGESLSKISSSIEKLSKEKNTLPTSLLNNLTNLNEANSTALVEMGNGLKQLSAGITSMPKDMPNMSSLVEFLKAFKSINFNTEAITAFNQLKVDQLKKITQLPNPSGDFEKLSNALKEIKEGVVTLNQIRKWPDFKALKVTSTTITNLEGFTVALTNLRTVLENFTDGTQKVINQLNELAQSFSGLKNLKEILNMSAGQVKTTKGAELGIDVKDSIASMKQYYAQIEKLKSQLVKETDADKIHNIKFQILGYEDAVKNIKELLLSNDLLTDSDKAYVQIEEGKINLLNKEIEAKEKALEIEKQKKEEEEKKKAESIDIDNAKKAEQAYQNLKSAFEEVQKAQRNLVNSKDRTSAIERLNLALQKQADCEKELQELQKQGIDISKQEQAYSNLLVGDRQDNQIKTLTSNLNKAISDYKEAMKPLKSGNSGSISQESYDNLAEVYKKAATYARELTTYQEEGVILSKEQTTALESFNKIQQSYATTLNNKLGNYQGQIDIFDENKVGKVSGYVQVLEEAKEKLAELRTASEALNNADFGTEAFIKAQEEADKLDKGLQELLNTLGNKKGVVKSGWSAGLGEIGPANDSTEAVQTMQNYVEKLKNAQIISQSVNGDMATLTYTIKGQQGEVNKVTLAWDGMSKSIKTVSTQQIKGISNLSTTLGKIATKIKEISIYYAGMYLSPFDLAMKAKEAIDVVVGLDTAMVELKKTTTATSQELNNFYSDANSIAKEYGNTTEEVITATADWSRMGYSLTESEELAKLSSQFSTISEDMSISDSGDTLISVMKAYNLETSDLLDIMSKINVVGNNFAVSNSDVAEGLRQSAAAMSVANSTLEENIALFTAGNEILRDSSSMGSALKSISMRIRGYDEETEQVSEDLVNISGDIADLTDGKVSIMSDENTYRSIYDILGQVANVWDELTDKNQAKLLEKLFAKTRAQAGAAIIKNWDTAEKSLEMMSDPNVSNSANEELENATESLEFKLNALKETWTGLWQDLFPRETLAVAIDFLTQLSSVIAGLVSKFGLLGSALAGAGIVNLLKNVGRLKLSSLFNVPTID